MPEKTYKIVDVVGVSDQSIHQGVRNALKKASQTLRNIDWFEVREDPRVGQRQGRTRVPGPSQDRFPSRKRFGLSRARRPSVAATGALAVTARAVMSYLAA